MLLLGADWVIAKKHVNRLYLTDDLMTIRVGTSGWSYAHWRGAFYPEHLAKSRWFDFYVERFNTVEVNATFYRNFKDSTYKKWCDRVPRDFRYVLKVPQLISHRHKLHDTAELIADFKRSAQLLGNRLGLLLLQLPPNLPCQPQLLEAALKDFVTPAIVAVELRGEHWLTEEVFTLLRKLGANYCNPDHPQHKLTSIVTGGTGYLRLHGRRAWYADNYTQEELYSIADTARKMSEQGAKEVYIFFNNDYAAYAPHNAYALSQLI
jgi:uncharacterized protein YecE (DUF72 family)